MTCLCEAIEIVIQNINGFSQVKYKNIAQISSSFNQKFPLDEAFLLPKTTQSNVSLSSAVFQPFYHFQFKKRQ